MRNERFPTLKHTRLGCGLIWLVLLLCMALASPAYAQVPVDIQKWNRFVRTFVLQSQVQTTEDPHWTSERYLHADRLARLTAVADLVGAVGYIDQLILVHETKQDAFEQAESALDIYINFFSVLMHFGLHELALEIYRLEADNLRQLPERFFVIYTSIAMKIHCELGNQRSLQLVDQLAKIFSERMPTFSDRTREHARVIATFQGAICLPPAYRQRFIELEAQYLPRISASVYRNYEPFRVLTVYMTFLAFDRSKGAELARVSGEPLFGSPIFMWQSIVGNIASQTFVTGPIDYRHIERLLESPFLRHDWHAIGIIGEERRLLQSFIRLVRSSVPSRGEIERIADTSVVSIESVASFVSAVSQSFQRGDLKDIHWAEIMRASESRYSLLACIGLAMLTDGFTGLPRLKHVCYLPRTPY